MAEATALVRRVELAVAGEELPVVAGVRNSAMLSIYFGPDPVYHFDGRNRLRRAFAGGRLYRTQGNSLAELTRVRTPSATELHRHDLDGPSLDEFVARMKRRLRRLHDALARGTAARLRQAPEGDDFIAELSERIAGVLSCAETLAPPIKGKRA
jgi:hypothetical protein